MSTGRTIARAGLCAILVAFFSHSAAAEDTIGRVTEAHGKFIKIEIVSGDGVKKGDTAALERAGGGEPGSVVITAVAEGYIVGKTTGNRPQAGDRVVFGAAAPATPGADGKRPAAGALDDAMGEVVSIFLRNGTELSRVKLLRVARDDKSGELEDIRIDDTRRDRRLTVSGDSIDRIVRGGTLIYLAKKTEGDAPATGKAAMARERAEREAEEHKRWLARLEAKGIKPWPALTKEQHEAALAEHGAIIKKALETYPNMRLYETEQFNFVSNISPEQCGPYVKSLDALHEMMCKMYRIKPGTPVWRGKCLVLAFMNRNEFAHFEMNQFRHSPDPATYGLCHSARNGDVIISCFRGDDPFDFGHMLVHETSHGFIHRYKTAERLPLWVNEGMAEYIGATLVPQSKSVKRKQAIALATMKQTRSMGGSFLNAVGGIDTWQYGTASSLNDFLIRMSKEKYVKFIEGMKEGLTWEESLLAAYDATPQQLVFAYGRAIGIPDLRP